MLAQKVGTSSRLSSKAVNVQCKGQQESIGYFSAVLLQENALTWTHVLVTE